MRNFIAIGLILLGACQDKKVSVSPTDSMAQQIGDAMVSIDEGGGSDGGYAFMARERKIVARFDNGSHRLQSLSEMLLPTANAASCALTNTWGACASNVITRDFHDCTYLGATFSGTITYTYTDAAVNNTCSITASGHSVARVPNFTITGPSGGSFAVSKTGSTGQVITQTGASAYSFANDGIRRVLTFSGTTLADFTTSTTTAIGLTGANRNGRVASGGTLRVLNNLTSVSCDFSPSAVTWGSACNCATSGTWTASCSDGKSASLALTSCGAGTFTYNGATENVTLDQCTSN
jgi:hypothetical protein